MLLNNKILLVFFVTFTFVMTSGQATARMYKWVDSKGVTQYSQHPPPEGTVEEIEKTYAPDAADLENTLKEGAKKREEFNKRHQERLDNQAQTKKEKKEKKKLALECTKAKERIKALKLDRRMQVKKGDTYTSMTKEMRQEQIKKLQEKIKKRCN